MLQSQIFHLRVMLQSQIFHTKLTILNKFLKKIKNLRKKKDDCKEAPYNTCVGCSTLQGKEK